MPAVCSGCGIGAAEGAPLTNSLGGLVRVGMWHERCWKRQNGPSEQCGGDLESTNSTGAGDSPADDARGPQISDPVNSPAHYKQYPVEVIEITEQLNFLLGNVVKYVLRADYKGKPLEDLRKAEWYLRREIRNREMRSE